MSEYKRGKGENFGHCRGKLKWKREKARNTKVLTFFVALGEEGQLFCDDISIKKCDDGV